MTQRPNAPSPNTFSFEIFFLFLLLYFLERFGNLDFFLELKKKKYIYIYIYMNKVHQMLHGFLEFKEI